jgi:hypothetical protein
MVSKVFNSAAHQSHMAGVPAARRVSQVKEAKARAKGKGGGGGHNGGGKLKDIVIKDGKEYYDGVDITDPNRRFSNKEFRKLRPIFRDHILPHRPPKEHTSNVSAVEQKKTSNGSKFGTNQYD